MRDLVIWKFHLEITDEQVLTIPERARILEVQAVDDLICMWLLVDPALPEVRQVIHIYGTGQPIPGVREPDEYHVGTVQAHGGVWHVFWVVED